MTAGSGILSPVRFRPGPPKSKALVSDNGGFLLFAFGGSDRLGSSSATRQLSYVLDHEQCFYFRAHIPQFRLGDVGFVFCLTRTPIERFHMVSQHSAANAINNCNDLKG